MIQAAFSDIVTAKAKVSDEEAKKYYEKNATRFKQPEGVKLRLISTKDEKKARDVLEMLKSGDDFSEIAYNMSEDSYREKSGDIGYMHKGRMVPEIEDAAFKLKIGETSEVGSRRKTLGLSLNSKTRNRSIRCLLKKSGTSLKKIWKRNGQRNSRTSGSLI